MKKSIVPLLGLLLGFSLFLHGCSDDASTSDENGTNTTASEDVKPEIPDSLLMAKGLEITSAAFEKLSGSLKQAMARGGVAEAVPYCNLMAWPLLDTVARENGVKLRRTALRYRNPSNQPLGSDSEVLQQFAMRNEAGEPPKPILKRGQGKPTAFYRPILLNEGCLPCHGSPQKDVAAADLELIRSLYPQDQAIDFQAGDLRGMWVVENIEGAFTEAP